MGIVVDNRRRQTMLDRIGKDAAELIDDMRYLPFYRSIQIRLEKMGKPEEWKRIIETAKTKDNPSRYFARLCKMVKSGTYQFAKEVAQELTQAAKQTAMYVSDKIKKFGFGDYHEYWVRKTTDFATKNGMAGLTALLEYADRKHINQRYFARAVQNGIPPEAYYQKNILGAKAC